MHPLHPKTTTNQPQAINVVAYSGQSLNMTDCKLQNNSVLLGQGGGISVLGGNSVILRTLISSNHAYQGGGLAYAGNDCKADDTEECSRSSLSIPKTGGTRIVNNTAVLSGGGVLVQAWRKTNADPTEVAAATGSNKAFTADDIALPPLALAWSGGKPPAALQDYASRVERWQGLLPLAVRVSGPGASNVMGVRLQVRVQPAIAQPNKQQSAAQRPPSAGRHLLQMAAKTASLVAGADSGLTSSTRLSGQGLGNVTLLGAECISNAVGVANFSSVQFKLRAPPGQYILTIVAPDYPEVALLSTVLNVRRCLPGEVQGPGGDSCEQCVDENWSRNPSNATCDACVRHAVCNGSSLSPYAGYWHSAPESVQVHACPNAEACSEGGVCSEGYAGPM